CASLLRDLLEAPADCGDLGGFARRARVGLEKQSCKLVGRHVPFVPGRRDNDKVASATSCFDDDLVLAYVRGTLNDAAANAAEVHVDGCTACRRLVAQAAKSFFSAPTRDGKLARGATVARYEIEHVIGVGGMGVVYRAFDPRLKRHVALKVVAASKAT